MDEQTNECFLGLLMRTPIVADAALLSLLQQTELAPMSATLSFTVCHYCLFIVVITGLIRELALATAEMHSKEL